MRRGDGRKVDQTEQTAKQSRSIELWLDNRMTSDSALTAYKSTNFRLLQRSATTPEIKCR
ncbi:hypothetical protein PO124_34640 [Bacillus licheniformis]|nr:hypothetical protein [Bacillus licheniformis]